MSWDRGVCPGIFALALVPGQTPLTQDVQGQNHYHITITITLANKIVKESQKSVSGLGRDRTDCHNPVLACLVAICQNLVPACPVARFLSLSCCPWDNKGISVPLFHFPGLSCLVGNPTRQQKFLAIFPQYNV